MRFCHAAALALVGWYLLVPPLTDDGAAYVGDAPLSRWKVQEAFDSAKQCEEYHASFLQSLGKEPVKQKVYLTVSQCIASDDPRLKP